MVKRCLLRTATEQEVLDRLGDVAGRPLLLCGHTHLQRLMRLPSGATVVNPAQVLIRALDAPTGVHRARVEHAGAGAVRPALGTGAGRQLGRSCGPLWGSTASSLRKPVRVRRGPATVTGERLSMHDHRARCGKVGGQR